VPNTYMTGAVSRSFGRSATRGFYKRTDLNLSPEHVRRLGHGHRPACQCLRPTPLWVVLAMAVRARRIDQFLVLLLSRRNRIQVRPTDRLTDRSEVIDFCRRCVHELVLRPSRSLQDPYETVSGLTNPARCSIIMLYILITSTGTPSISFFSAVAIPTLQRDHTIYKLVRSLLSSEVYVLLLWSLSRDAKGGICNARFCPSLSPSRS